MAVSTRRPPRTRPTPHNTHTNPRRPARPSRLNDHTSAYRRGLLIGAGIGLTTALAIAATAVLAVTATSLGDHLATRLDPSTRPATQPAPDPQAAAAATVTVDAKHLGDLKVLIQAQVASGASNSALTRAEVVATTDMRAMPMAHRQGPIRLHEVPGQPGRYQATTTVTMLGDYDIHVEARKPLKGAGHQTITVGTVPAGGAPAGGAPAGGSG